MRTLAWLNLLYPALVVVTLAAVVASAGDAGFEPARLSDAAAYDHREAVFVQFTNAIVPIAILLVAHMLAYRAARTRAERARRRARSWCFGLIVLVALFGLQAGWLGAFDGLRATHVAACIGGLVAMVAVCVLDLLIFRRPADEHFRR
ncbi:MAG: hypothetical protein NDI84_07020 [Steroidobacteraceae bacterium]|nr:hypothetical protein [Steroidobacteraceae bacterium]